MDRTVLKIALKCEVEGGSNYNTGLEEGGWFGLGYFILQVYPSNLLRGPTFFELNRTWFLSCLNMSILGYWVIPSAFKVCPQKNIVG